MRLALLQNYTAVRNIGLSVPFGATGGTAPYAYSVVGGGAGGTINGSTGIYLSPVNSTGVDQIVVTDSTSPTPLTASGSILVGTPIELVCDIFQNQLGLSVDQVWLYQQKVNIPSDSRSYVVVGIQSNKFFGNKPSYVGGSSTLAAVQSINVQQKLTVELFSRSLAPLVGIEQLGLALASPYAEQQMELNSFFVAPLPESAVNIGIVDGAAIPYHFQMRVNLQYASVLQTSPSFFSSFGSPSVVVEPPVSALVSIDVSPDSVTLAEGQTQQFAATGNYSLSPPADLTNSVTWAVEPISGGSATITSGGLASATSVGGASVSATKSGISGKASILVVSGYDPATDPNFAAVWESDSGIVSSAGAVSSWTDRTANAHVASQATSANQPAVIANQLNGIQVVRYGGTGGLNYLTIPSSVLPASTSPFSIYFIIRPAAGNVSNYNNSLAFSLPDVSDDSFLFAYNSTISDGGYLGNPYWGGSSANWNTFSYGPNLTPGGFVYDTSDFQVWAITYNGSGLKTAANFAMIQAGTNLGCASNPGNLDATSLNAIGSSNPGGRPEYDTGGVYVATTILTGSELTNFQNYILTKWGLVT